MPKSCSDCILPHIEAHYYQTVWAKTFHLCPFVDEYVDGCMQRRHPDCPLQEVINMSIWHKKTERPEKKLHCTRLIVTKFGSVFDEKEIDSGAYIETDWAYLDDLIECAKVKE